MPAVPKIGPLDPNRAHRAVRELLSALGFDPAHPELSKTPERFVEAYGSTLLTGYDTPLDQTRQTSTGFPSHYSGPLTYESIPLFFVCPHHLSIAEGHVHIGLWVHENVPGLGQIQRIVDTHSRRLILQEELTRDLCQALTEKYQAEAVVVRITARHGCLLYEDFARRDVKLSSCALFGPQEHTAYLDRDIAARIS